MRCVSSCLLLVAAPFLLHIGSPEAVAGSAAFRGRAGYHVGVIHAPRPHARIGRFVHRPGFHGRFAHRPFARHRYGFAPYGFNNGPLVASSAGETAMVNEIEAPPISADPGGVPTAAGIRYAPAAAPVIYVLDGRRSHAPGLRGRGGALAGPYAPAVPDETLPRIVHVAVPRGR